MLTGVAFCPQAPVLVPALAQEAAGELDDLRAACRTAIRRVARPGTTILAVGSGRAQATYPASARASFAGFGVPLELSLGSDPRADGPDVESWLPPSLAVGAWLLRDALGPDCGASGYSVGAAAGAFPDLTVGRELALLVLGDGSACRSLKAPGYVDDRAADFDAAIAAAMRHGDGDQLHPPGYADGLPEQLQAAGAPVWEALAGHLTASGREHGWDAELLYDDAPYGVGYLVAAWTSREWTRHGPQDG